MLPEMAALQRDVSLRCNVTLVVGTHSSLKELFRRVSDRAISRQASLIHSAEDGDAIVDIVVDPDLGFSGV